MKAGLRVLFTASGSHIGGATMAMAHLMLGLPSVGVEPILLATPPKPSYRSLFRRLREKGVKLVLSRRRFERALFWIWLFFAALKSIRGFRINLVHCHGTKEAAVVGLAARLMGRKVVYTVEGDPIMEIALSPESYGPVERVILHACWRLGLKFANVVVGCSRWMARHLSRYGVKAQYAHNAIDYERFASAADRGASSTIISVARFERVKGLETLVKAAAEVAGSRPDARFLLIGGGSLKNHLKDLAGRLGISDKIRFLDYSPEVDRLLERSAIAVLPSLYEPFGMAAAEALAAGKPVVASMVGGLREIVIDGVNGFLFAPGDYRELADKILKLLEDRDLRKRMGEAARETAKRFKPENIARRYAEIYRGLLKTG